MKPRKAKPKKKLTPAKPRAAARTVEQRIERIAYLMIKGRWCASWIPRLAKAWGLSPLSLAKLADRAGVRVEIAAGKLEGIVCKAHLDLDEIQREARKAGQYTAAVRAVEARCRLAGAFAQHRPGRPKPAEEAAPRGLPPELAALAPPPSREEVEHFATTDPETCGVEACRVHGKAAPAPEAVH